MNQNDIEQAKDRDLAGSIHAIRRAAKRARQVAAQTGTALIMYASSHDGNLPSSLSMLYPREIPGPTTFWNPGDANPWPLTIDNDVPNQPNSAQISFEYLGAGRNIERSAP